MNLEKIKVFGELQDEIFEMTGGSIPLVDFYLDEEGMSIRNPFFDSTGRFLVDPIKEYGEQNLLDMETQISKLEQELGCVIEDLEAHDLYLYLAGNFYKEKEPGKECFEKISFEDEPMFMDDFPESDFPDTLNFYIPLTNDWEQIFPEAALALVCPLDDDKQLNLYADYNIKSKKVSLTWTCNEKSGNVKISEEAEKILLSKMDAYVRNFHEESLEKMVNDMLDKNILDLLKEQVEKVWYEKADENGVYHIEIPADYRETNEGFLKNAYENRNSSDLKNSIIDEIYESYMDTIINYEFELLNKAGLGVGHAYHDRAMEVLRENIYFNPDYDHFMNDDMRLNLLLSTDWERNSDHTDIKENLSRWIDKEAFTEMKEDCAKYGTDLERPDNGLMWLVEQQGYTLEDLQNVKEAYDNFFYEDGDPKNFTDFDTAYKEFTKNHSPFLTSVCEELENHTYRMGCLTVLVESSLNEFCELFERAENTNTLSPKEIVLSKDSMLGIHDPWNGAGSLLGIVLEKDLVLPNSLIFDSEIEGVKRNSGWTVDEISGLCFDSWKTAKEIRDVEVQNKSSLDDMILNAMESIGEQKESKIQTKHLDEPQTNRNKDSGR